MTAVYYTFNLEYPKFLLDIIQFVSTIFTFNIDVLGPECATGERNRQ